MTPFATLAERTRLERDRMLSLPIFTDLANGNFDLQTYRAFLFNAYHHVRHTVPLMMACGAALPDRHDWLRPALIEYIKEENGHEQWILEDLACTGMDPATVRDAAPTMPTELLISYVYDFIQRRNPVGFLGMVHVLEGTSTALATSAAELIQRQLKLPDGAFSYLTSHGELDREHVQFFEQLINEIGNGDDMEAIVLVARRVYHLYGAVLDSVPRGACHRVA